ncbi:MAG: ATPase, partial [gamma proteobacterium symbiont of Ctena orbiculata]
SDSIFIRNNITFHNLKPVSTFLGMLGNPELGGIPLTEFKRRQNLHRQAEIAAMYDVPSFMRKSRMIYGYSHFINDVGGSLCELDEPGLLEFIAEHSLIIYIKATEEDEAALIARSMSHPKPLYYREAFLDEHLAEYMRINGIDYVSLIDPYDFGRWVFPRLFRARIPRYEAIARNYGYTVTTKELSAVADESDFLQLLEAVIDRESNARSVAL